MTKVQVLLEVDAQETAAFEAFNVASTSRADAIGEAERLLEPVAGLGVELRDTVKAVPMFSAPDRPALPELEAFAAPEESPDLPAETKVVPAEVDSGQIEELAARPDVTVWPNSQLTLLAEPDPLFQEPVAAIDREAVDAARSRAGVDCRPFRPGVEIATIRELLGTDALWSDGFRGQNVTVGILDEGVNGSTYPISGGFSRPGARAPGTASIKSHGSMCAADVLIAAPMARLYDYPFLGIPSSGGALAMFQAALDNRRRDGTPHVTTNSYGFVAVPPQSQAPNHEIWNLNHPLNRKVREVVASGAPTFFAAGNCGTPCPSGRCDTSGIGPGRSIHAANSLAEVITIAAVNSRHERIGYSSQGPGMFEDEKPDLASYSHVFANFGPGRPGGTDDSPFDNGTSAATPVAAGVGALLMSAYPALTPAELRDVLVRGATRISAGAWDPDYGRGIVNAAASYALLRRDGGGP